MAAGRRRIFIAVPLGPSLQEAAQRVRLIVEREAHRFRWVASHNLHLTLRFLGEITDAQVDRAVEAARDAAKGSAPFSVTLEGVGGFPSLRSPRVLWVGVTAGAEQLTALAGLLDVALRARHFPRDDRPFHPHLTVARARNEGRPPDLSGLAGEAVFLGSQQVDALVVMESVLGRSGPTYTEVARWVIA